MSRRIIHPKLISLTILSLTVFGLLGVPVAVSAQSDDGALLKWKFADGQKTMVEMSQKQSMEMSLSGNKNSTTATTKSWIRWEVDEIDSDGVVKLKTIIQRMKMDSESPLGKTSVDTAIAADDEGQDAAIGSKIRPLIDVAIEQRINASGKTISIKLPEALVAAAPPGTKQMLEQISKNGMIEFPPNPLRVGDQWSNSFESASPIGTMKLTNAYTYKGVETIKGKPLHHIGQEITMQFLEGGENASIDITEQNTTGNLYFDAEKGRIDHSDVEQDVKLTITIQGQKLEQSIKSSTQVQFSDAVGK